MRKQQPLTHAVIYDKFCYPIADFYTLITIGIRVLFKEGWRAFLLKVVNQFKSQNLSGKQPIYLPSASANDIQPRELGDVINLCDLKPDESILDVGCGTGRMAVALTGYLNERGTYHGFDIAKAGIDRCNHNIAANYPNFHFQWVEIYNKAYNPSGTIKAREFRFPYGDDSFDFVFLASIFTHMLPDDINSYLGEINRVLKSGGRCLITFFLLNKESSELIKRGGSTLNFRYERANYSFENWQTRESAIAYTEEYILGLYKSKLLNIKTPIYYGSWCGRQNPLTYQDIIIAEKVFNKE